VLKGLRNQGVDPSHGGEAAAKRAVAMRDRLAANAAWEAVSHPELDGVDFTRDVLPKVRTTPVRQLAKATGLSLIYCSGVRSGEKVPHPRHWDALRWPGAPAAECRRKQGTANMRRPLGDPMG